MGASSKPLQRTDWSPGISTQVVTKVGIENMTRLSKFLNNTNDLIVPQTLLAPEDDIASICCSEGIVVKEL